MDPLRTLAPWADALKFGPIKIRSRDAKRIGQGVATFGLSEAGGARGLLDLQERDLTRQQHHADDTAQAEAAASKAAADEAERLAAQQAGQARTAAKRRRGIASTILAGGNFGLFAPTPSGRTLLGQ